MSLDYRGEDFTATATVANPDLINGSGVMVLHYLQSITTNLALGAEIAYQAGTQIPGGEIAILSAAARLVPFISIKIFIYSEQRFVQFVISSKAAV